MDIQKQHSFIDELTWRGLIYRKTPGIEKVFERGTTLYLGIDPTGADIHLGHLLWVLFFKRAQMWSNKTIVIVGGGTAMIGDPSGKDEERQVLSSEQIEENKAHMKKELERFLPNVVIVDNVQWLTKITLVDFLRDAGKYITVNSMIDKEAVSERLKRKDGISYAEFSYQLMQAYDFLELYNRYGCEVQVGGSDQWGNIIQGVELIRKKLGKEAHGLSFPLIVNPKTGKKFGKTEKGAAIWLDPEKTHPFAFYQFLVNVEDELAPILMRYYSFKSREEIEALEKEWNAAREKRLLQKSLANELTELVHGKETADQAQKVASILFEKGQESLTEENLTFVKKALPYKTMQKGSEFSLESTLVDLGLAASKNEARRLIEQNGVKSDFLFNKYYLIRKGKREYGIIEAL